MRSDIFIKNKNFILLLFLWLFTGMYLGPVIYGLLPITLLFLKNKKQYQEILLGFFFILILSDSRSDSLQFAVTVKDIYIVMMALFLFFDKKDFTPFNKFYVAFIPFFLVAVLCLFFSPSDVVATSVEKTLSYFFLLLAVPNYVFRCHREKGEAFYKALIYFGISILIAGFMLKYINPPLSTMEGRFRGMLGNPNGLGIFTLLFFLLFSTVLKLYPHLFNRWEKIITYGVILLSLYLCESRSSLFGIVIYLFFSYFYKISPFLGFIVFLVFAGSYQYISANIVTIVESVGLQGYLRSNTLVEASGRFYAWHFAWENIQQNVFIGKGFEYTNYLFDVNQDFLSALGHQGNAHNSYITLWLDTGLFGLVTYLWAMVLHFIRAASKFNFALPIMYAVIFSSFFESWLSASLNPFTIQFFIILAILTNNAIIPPKTTIAVPVQ